MSFSIVTVIPLISVYMVLRRTVIRDEQIRKIKERSDQIIDMICGNGITEISDANID